MRLGPVDPTVRAASMSGLLRDAIELLWGQGNSSDNKNR
jgi:hypothetical protein